MRSKTRPSLSREDYEAECLAVLRRQLNLCLGCKVFLTTSVVTDANFHHVVKRSRGGSDDRETSSRSVRPATIAQRRPTRKGSSGFPAKPGTIGLSWSSAILDGENGATLGTS